MRPTPYIVNFVYDCGADPTGVADCKAALDNAVTILKTLILSSTVPSKSLTLYIPPGKYLFSTNFSTPYNFSGSASALKIQGSGKDSSLFLLPGGINAPSFQNLCGIEMRDLTWIGIATPGTPDVAAGITLSATGPSRVHNCRFANIEASSWALCLEGSEWTLSDVLFTNCACTDATKGVLYTTSIDSVTMDSCHFFDVGSVNGFSAANKTAYSLAPWYRHDDSGTLVSGGGVHGIIFRNCWFDEQAQGQIKIVGGPTANVNYVHVEACMFNPSVFGAYPLIDLENVNVATVEGVLDSGFNSTSAAPVVNAVGVLSLTCRAIQVNTGANSKSIAADANCKVVRIIDSPNVTTSVNAAVTLLIENNGVMQPADAPPTPSTGAVVYVDSADSFYKVKTATGLTTLCGSHGMVEAGSAGVSDLAIGVGPYPGSETSFSGVFFYGHGNTGTNWGTAIYSNLASITLATASGWGLKWAAGALQSVSGSTRMGTAFAGASLTLTGDSDVTCIVLGNGTVDLHVATTTTAPGAGAAGALPATPAGYATISVGGVAHKIPYY